MRGEWILAALLAATTCVHAQNPDAAPPDPTDDPLVIRAGFLNAHPDLQYRMYGLDAYKRHEFAKAFRYFRRAAFYADKPSQGMIAEMYWNGQGQALDRVQAYIWMDLAAERGYTGFLGLRERYWAALSAEERTRAVAAGQEVYAKFGDAAAKPRIAATIRRAANRMTGSRAGATIGNLQIVLPGAGGPDGGGELLVDGSKFYDKRYWDPDEYQKWQDSVWAKPRIGRVTVGEVESADAALPPMRSRVPAVAPDHNATEPDVPEEAQIPPKAP